MNLKQLTLISTFALAALAAAPGYASAHDGHGTSQQEYRRDRGRGDYNQHAAFHREEAQRRAEQDRERRERAERRAVRYENERRVALRQFGPNSAEYRGFVLRWERRWNDYLAGEQRTMVQQRMAARARHETYHLRVADYEYLRVDDDCIQRELARSGVKPFPHERERVYGNDNRGREYDRDRRNDEHNRRDNDRRDDRRGHPDVDWSFGVRVNG